ncbi:D-alanyl-D-alanine carboxypeptidase/D-alanyl-D-alanine-endopeptidase [Homoserinibacter sp. GY 40078]|uniref:D-alanyl-D-alanine carboxypeptidase/D-alanyl-D-alanine-endopeptidase n=1 Tax=Homoserinibacter sp. GY 40078 TaxID=2603275 RepID=UPI0011CA2A55|nr:D-alanyl-D-alanine carboxypeptidase [Homoserinibacter sp. GY 40078]TXK18426.1 D-alanyl-D-alanine carboxypeptidase [Homoserinibacter sp. GY 40078]
MSDEQPTSRRAARERAGAAAAPAEPGGSGGFLAMVRRHPLAWIVSAGAVVFVLLGTGSVFAGVAWASRPATAATPTPSDTPTEEAPRPVADSVADPARVRTCSVASVASASSIATLYGSVIRQDTGKALFARHAADPAPPASVLKLFTASAAIAALGGDYRITTSVYEGSAPGTIVLVGRGDATLSQLPEGSESVYAGAPKLQTLAEETVAAYQARYPGVPITQVVLDATYWDESDSWLPSWREDQRTQGYQSAATALQVDGDRADPRAAVSPRSTDPIGRAGQKFLDALRAADPGGVVDAAVATSRGKAVGSTVLSEVQSQPVSTLVRQMLIPSDNALGEMLARIVSVKTGQGGSAASLQTAVLSQLSQWGVPLADTTIVDGSGLSPQNAVPAKSFSTLMRAIADGTDGLSAVRDGLSKAGESGTLAGRFTGDNAASRGHVVAKSGMIRGSYTLSGIIDAADGTTLVFTFYAARDGVDSSAREGLDALTTAVYRCGDNLSNK